MNPEVEVYYDGLCPLCRREIELLRRLDRRDRIRFTDISAPGFSAASLGLDHQQLMARIHARVAREPAPPPQRPSESGELIEGVEVFRRLYQAVGFGPLVALSRLPGISWGLDRAYAWFARNRLRITGRCTAETCALP